MAFESPYSEDRAIRRVIRDVFRGANSGPLRQKFANIDAVRGPVSVEVALDRAPTREQQAEIGRVDDAVTVEVGGIRRVQGFAINLEDPVSRGSVWAADSDQEKLPFDRQARG
jgi:hypothetical protein